jgi:6-phosphogluconolactonase
MQRISRRVFVKSSAVLSLGAHPWFAAAKSLDSKALLLVGTQTTGASKGIYAYHFDDVTGELAQIGLAAEADNPTFLALAPRGERVFVVNEIDHYEGKDSGAVSSFTLDRKSAKLTSVNEVPSLGGGPCHVAVDHTGHCVFAANYGGGSAASFAVGDGGRLSDAVSFFQYTGHGPDPTRQKAPHAHRVTVSPENRFLLVNDLGLDEIHIYRLDAATAKLAPNEPSVWKSAPGAGPRALRFHPSGKWAYCLNEMKATVTVLRWDGMRGTLETVQDVSMMPEGGHGTPAASEIVLDKQARFAYAANRLDDFMVTFAISPDGRLTVVDRSSCGGKTPRHIALAPGERWLLVANQVSDNIAVFARDAKTGKLAKYGKSFPLSRPQCLVFA